MGLVDAIAAEDRMEIKVSEYRRMAHIEAKAFYLKNAIDAQIPYGMILKFLHGTEDELEEYRSTGLTPEKIREMDNLYLEKCVEVNQLKQQLDDLKKEESGGR